MVSCSISGERMGSIVKSKVAKIIQTADEGDAKAQFLLSIFYRKGFLVEYDEEKWLHYLKKAAEQDLPIACMTMGMLYEDKDFEDSDPELARKWYEKAADLGMTEAMRSLAYLALERDEPDYDEFLKLLEKAAEKGNWYAAYDLGTSFAIGFGTDKDYTRAREYLETAVQNGIGSAFYNLGVMYFNGDGVERDYKKARKNFLKATEHGEARGYTGLGFLSLYGLGLVVNHKKGIKLLQKAASACDPFACVMLGKIFDEGVFTEKNSEAAEKYLMLADKYGFKFRSNHTEAT